MRAVATKAEHEARITKALLKLSSARREKLTPLDFEVFVVGLASFDASVVEQVCDEFGRIAPDEFQPKFPPLYQLREQCFRTVEAWKERRKALKAAPLEERFPPLSPERFEEIKAMFRQAIGRKEMPQSAAGDRE